MEKTKLRKLATNVAMSGLVALGGATSGVQAHENYIGDYIGNQETSAPYGEGVFVSGNPGIVPLSAGNGNLRELFANKQWSDPKVSGNGKNGIFSHWIATNSDIPLEIISNGGSWEFYWGSGASLKYQVLTQAEIQQYNDIISELPKSKSKNVRANNGQEAQQVLSNRPLWETDARFANNLTPHSSMLTLNGALSRNLAQSRRDVDSIVKNSNVIVNEHDARSTPVNQQISSSVRNAFSRGWAEEAITDLFPFNQEYMDLVLNNTDFLIVNQMGSTGRASLQFDASMRNMNFLNHWEMNAEYSCVRVVEQNHILGLEYMFGVALANIIVPIPTQHEIHPSIYIGPRTMGPWLRGYIERGDAQGFREIVTAGFTSRQELARVWDRDNPNFKLDDLLYAGGIELAGAWGALDSETSGAVVGATLRGQAMFDALDSRFGPDVMERLQDEIYGRVPRTNLMQEIVAFAKQHNVQHPPTYIEQVNQTNRERAARQGITQETAPTQKKNLSVMTPESSPNNLQFAIFDDGGNSFFSFEETQAEETARYQNAVSEFGGISPDYRTYRGPLSKKEDEQMELA